MSKTNCINCGAAKDTSDIKCPFCGTTYLDMTAIDFSLDDPVVCQFVLPHSDNKLVLSMLAKPRLEEIEMKANTVDVYGGFGQAPLYSCTSSYDMNVGVSFMPIMGRNNTLFTMKQIEGKE